MAVPFLASGVKLAAATLPKVGQFGSKVFGGAVGSKGGLAGLLGYVGASKALEYSIVNPALGFLGIRNAPPPPAPQAAGGTGLSQARFEQLYGSQGWGIGPFRIPGTGQTGFLEQQQRENRQLQRELGLGQQGTQRYGFDTQRDIARTNAETQRAINQTQRELGFANLRTQYGISDLTARRQLQGVFSSHQRDVALADRNLAASYNRDRTQSRIASMQTNLGRYQADRTTENVRISQVAPQIAAIAGIYNRRY